MASLTTRVLQQAHTILLHDNIQHALGVMPKTQAYKFPFVTYDVIATKLYSYTTSGYKMEDALLQFSIYSKDNDYVLSGLAQTIRSHYEQIPFVISDYEVNMVNFNGYVGPIYNGKDRYWQLILTYKIVATKFYEDDSSSE